MEPIPEWAEKSMQGIAFWLGYGRVYFWGHPIPEAAMVTELCKLINTNLSPKLRLRCEVPHAEFIKNFKKKSKITKASRLDLVVEPKEGKEGIPTFIIEVKRGRSSKKMIDSDLTRLAEIHRGLPGVRTFLFLISEYKLPKTYVSEDGKSPKKKIVIKNANKEIGYARVRRVLKAGRSFSKIQTSHFACIIEVFS